MYDKNGGRQITAIYDSKKRPQFESTKFDEKRCDVAGGRAGKRRKRRGSGSDKWDQG